MNTFASEIFYLLLGFVAGTIPRLLRPAFEKATTSRLSGKWTQFFEKHMDPFHLLLCAVIFFLSLRGGQWLLAYLQDSLAFSWQSSLFAHWFAGLGFVWMACFRAAGAFSISLVFAVIAVLNPIASLFFLLGYVLTFMMIRSQIFAVLVGSSSYVFAQIITEGSGFYLISAVGVFFLLCSKFEDQLDRALKD